MKKILAIILAALMLLAFAGCSSNSSDKEDTKAEAQTEAQEIVTVADVYAANDIDTILANHTSVTASVQSSEGENIITTGKCTIKKTPDGNVELASDITISDEHVQRQGFMNSGSIFTVATGDDSIGLQVMLPAEFTKYAQQYAYLYDINNYTYTNEVNSMQDGALIVDADLDDGMGHIYLFVNPETLELYAINFMFNDNNNTTNIALDYDSEEALGITVADDALANGGAALVNVKYTNNDGTTEEYNYNAPVGSVIKVAGMTEYDTYTDEAATEESYTFTYTVESQDDVTLYAVAIPQ